MFIENEYRQKRGPVEKAQQILRTKSEIQGERYWHDHKGLKRALDLIIASPSSVAIALPVMALAGAAVYLDDGNWPPY